jgi:uncharacterized protein with HEPN domain
VKDDALYLQHLQECLLRIEQYTAAGRAAFLASTLIQDSVLRNLQTLGQSVLQLSEPWKAAHPEVGWKSIVGLRNVLVHDYLGVNVTRIWEIVERDLPDLKAKLAKIRPSSPP